MACRLGADLPSGENAAINRAVTAPSRWTTTLAAKVY
jgi:hypothetical protein